MDILVSQLLGGVSTSAAVFGNDGASFMDSVVNYYGPAICKNAALREAVYDVLSRG